MSKQLYFTSTFTKLGSPLRLEKKLLKKQLQAAENPDEDPQTLYRWNNLNRQQTQELPPNPKKDIAC